VNPLACYHGVGESRKNFPTNGEEAVSHQETKLGGMEDSEAKEIKLSNKRETRNERTACENLGMFAVFTHRKVFY